MTEKEINESLYGALQIYLMLRKKGKGELAIKFLRLASNLAELNLKLAGIKNYKVYCPLCEEQLTNGNEIEFFNQVGQCATCDKISTEYLFDNL